MFAKLFESKIGTQVLFTIDDDSDGNGGIKVSTTTKDGARMSVHLGIDDNDIDNAFELVSQEMADEFAEQYCTKSAVDHLLSK